MRYKVKRFSNQKDLLCLLCCVLSTCIIIQKKICHGSTIFTSACIIKYILTFVIDSVLHSAMWISPVVLGSFTKEGFIQLHNARQFLHPCVPVEMFFEHFSYKGAPVNCRWAICYANKFGALKKRQLVQVAFDEEHAVWNGQCRALKERVHPHGLLRFRFFWQRSISPPVRQADSFNTMMPSHFSPSELRRPFCFFEVQGSRLTRRPFRLHQSLTSVSVLMKSLKKFQGFSRSAKVNSCKFVCDDRKFPAHLLSFSVIMEVKRSWGNGSRKMKGLYRGSLNPKSHFIGCKKKKLI